MAAPWLYGLSDVALALMLAQFQAARAKLALGEKETTVSYEGKSVTFTQTELAKVDAALADILAAINELSGLVMRRGPIYAAF